MYYHQLFNCKVSSFKCFCSTVPRHYKPKGRLIMEDVAKLTLSQNSGCLQRRLEPWVCQVPLAQLIDCSRLRTESLMIWEQATYNERDPDPGSLAFSQDNMSSFLSSYPDPLTSVMNKCSAERADAFKSSLCRYKSHRECFIFVVTRFKKDVNCVTWIIRNF